ncbi:hypothetical protein [Nitrosomonas sp. Nm166]|uniref:hypothetical protein n=1 Tax=Nitrosomonas sp. Nm166 TaxID=1881054 RepID=UPI0008E2D988|nr:hypothetical protein [Nitrosomonas sp. Nm166]SFF16627.1 hypothetical protein SAMN05428977_10617 [Nitrosomonas sp. Nm166]
MKKLLISILSGFLLLSAPAFADYTQTQNKVDDKENSPKPVPFQTDKKSEQKPSEKGGAHPEGPRDDAAEKGSAADKSRDSSK